ncbi:MAG: hypothetical protein ABJQ08_11700 [Paracoccaceae bacterium]
MTDLAEILKTKLDKKWVAGALCMYIILEIVRDTEFSGAEAIFVITQTAIVFGVVVYLFNNIDKIKDVKELDKKSNKLDKVNDDGPPNRFDFEYVKKKIVSDYGSDAGILAIRYGSSVSNPHVETDEDWLILVHGNYYTEESKKETLGVSAPPDIPDSRSLDVQKRLFDGFLFGLLKGKPYELSVAIDGLVEHSYQMHPNYFAFLQMIAVRTNYQKVDIAEELQNDLTAFTREYESDVYAKNPYDVVVSAYNLTCTLIQLRAVEEMSDLVDVADVYALSKVSNMGKLVHGEENIVCFERLVGLFKSKERPELLDEFIAGVNALRRSLRDS